MQSGDAQYRTGNPPSGAYSASEETISRRATRALARIAVQQADPDAGEGVRDDSWIGLRPSPQLFDEERLVHQNQRTREVLGGDPFQIGEPARDVIANSLRGFVDRRLHRVPIVGFNLGISV